VPQYTVKDFDYGGSCFVMKINVVVPTYFIKCILRDIADE